MRRPCLAWPLPAVAVPSLLLAPLLSLWALQAEAQGRPDTPVNPFGADPAAVSAGQRVFEAGCVACHGAAAAGTERAPALNTGSFKHGSEDFDILETIQKGVPGTQMPPAVALKAEQLWQLVSYLRSLSATAPVAAQQRAAGDADRGERLFFGAGECASCHEINGRGVPLAADLSEIGNRPVAAIQAGIQHRPGGRPQSFGPAPRYVDVVLNNGTQLTGLVRSEDSFALVLQSPAGEPILLDRRQARSVSPSAHRVSPARLASDDDAADLLAYLSVQKRRAVVSSDVPGSPGLSPARLVRAHDEPQNWLTYWGSYASEHFSELTQINRQNVGQLQSRWAVPMPGSSPLEATPLVVDGLMYVAGPPGDVYALDARSGLQLWKFHRPQEKVSPYQINPYNRGVAVLGQRVFVNTLDDNLIALDARSGRVLWERRVADYDDGYTMTGAPLALDGRVIVGISGGELGVRGFVAAYDAQDGHPLWRFDTIPGPGQPGHETWSGDSWKTGSGATWLTGSYDPQLHLLYWAVGNPGPDYDPEGRQGDNLYSCSVLALDPDSGRLVWHYQISPHDTHDWDSTEDFILAEEPIKGQTRKVLLHADRNGFFYTIDRATGQLISATPFVRQSWNKGFAPDGRPIVDPASVSTREGHPVFPAVGGTNFQAPSYDSTRHVLFLSFIDSQGRASYQTAEYRRGQQFTGSHFGGAPPGSSPPAQPSQGIMALDTLTGAKLWSFPLTRASLQAGVMATRSGVVFAATSEGNLIALDARNGASLWHFQTGGAILAAPMSYGVDGAQFIAIAAGNMLYSFALPVRRSGHP